MGCACFAGGGDDRSIPRSCCAVVVAFAGATVGAVVAGVVAAAGAATAGAALAGAAFAAELLLVFDLLAFLAFFFGCCGESRPWNAWADAPPETSSARSRATGRSERNMSLTLGGTAGEEERQPDIEEELVPDLVLGAGRRRRALGLLSVDGVTELEAQRHP